MWERLMKKFVAWIDPKLDKYRKKTPAPKYTPKTLEEFVGVMRRTPQSVISKSERAKISAIMCFDSRKVKDLMIKKSDMVFVYEKDFLGPLTLDRLYKSGFLHFPVIDKNNHVLGVIHTEALNALEIKKTDRADKFLDKNVHYLHENDQLPKVVEELRRTGCFYYLVLNDKEELAGFFTIEMLLDYLLA